VTITLSIEVAYLKALPFILEMEVKMKITIDVICAAAGIALLGRWGTIIPILQGMACPLK